ncbi:hypothetical protein SLEP1_g13828 [Rubroshorea leprosula]|uniref:Uncharacterized protein n=1 Tax=Rubroshorea leprosula TaxID=152421 RepID=A0AAV5IQ48_9ROSI|nr:hypothetical protein SLEP1_g13828 [Rubroshorea leprosula]
MPASLFCFFLVLMFSSSLPVSMAIRDIPSSVPSTMRPASVDYMKMDNDEVTQGHQVFHDREVKGCLPKGYRRSSAPSRYVNYQPLGSCVSKNDPRKP